MNTPSFRCRCPSVETCTCSDSHWQHFRLANNRIDPNLGLPPSQPHTPVSRHHEPGAPPLQQYYYPPPSHQPFSPSPLSGLHHYNPLVAAGPDHRSPSGPYPTSSAIPFPAIRNFGQDITTTTVNDSSQTLRPAPKRRRADPSTGNRKRVRTSANGSTSTTGCVTTEAIVGVGPPACDVESVPVSSSLSAGNPTLQAIEHVVNAATSRRAISDVYFFMKPLASDEEPAVLATAEAAGDFSNVPLITSKPKDSPFLGCRLCKTWRKPWKNTDGIVTTIRKHLNKEHRVIYSEVVDRLGLGSGRSDRSGSDITQEPFSLERWHELLMQWIVADDQSINVVDCPEFRKFSLYGRSNLCETDLLHRTALTKLIYQTFREENSELKKDLQHALGRVSFTDDIWSDPNLVAFMAMTSHFCARNQQGKLYIANRLLAFCMVEGSHDGETIGQLMFDIVKDAGVIHSMGQFTLDNASNNNTAMEKLERLCDIHGIDFSADGNRVRCFPHIINIASQTVSTEIKENPRAPASPAPLDDFEKEIAHDRYVNALASDPITKCRNLVCACRKSGQRRADFKSVILEGNKDESWGKVLRPVQLLRDVETRWSSMFLMIGRVIELYPAIQVFLNRPKQAALISNLFTQDEFQVLHDIYTIFQVPHAAQELLSAEKTPTLSMALPAFEMLIASWIHLQATIPELAHYIGVGIAKINEYVSKGRKSRIYALAMIINPITKLDWIKKHWSQQDARNARKWMLQSMTQFCTSRRHAQTRERQGNGTLAQSLTCPNLGMPSDDSASAAQVRGMAKLMSLTSTSRRIVSLPTLPGPPLQNRAQPMAQPRAQTSSSSAEVSTPVPELTALEKAALEENSLKLDEMTAENELNKYLGDGLVESSSSFDLVQFWDVNEVKYPLLFRVALDVLPVQASAVPCERVFSSSKETCTLRRNRISSSLLEALQVLKYSFKQDRLDFMAGHLAREEDYMIEGELTPSAIEELITLGKLDELADLIHNSQQSDLFTVSA